MFFFGGGWQNGSPSQFAHQAERLAQRGMVAACADYRVKSKDGVGPRSCVEDAKSAVRWLRANGARLGIDPERIVAEATRLLGDPAAHAAMARGGGNPYGDGHASERILDILAAE